MKAAKIEAVNGRAIWAFALSVTWLVCASIILSGHTATHDQRYLLEQSFQRWWHPLESGITSRVLTGLVALLTDNSNTYAYDLAFHNAVVRCVSATVALTGLTAALVAVRASLGLSAICLSVFVTSGAPWLWVSPEVLAGGWLAWSLWAYLTERMGWLVAFLWLLSFTKPDLVLPGVTLGLVLLPVRYRWALFAVTGVTVALSFLSTESTNRALLSFGQHYAYLKTGVFGDLNDWRIPLVADFGQDMSLRQAITSHPALYSWFLVRSVGLSLYNVWITGLAIILPVALWSAWLMRDRLMTGAAVFVVLNVAIITALSFTHTRYLVRFLVLALIVMALALTRNDLPHWFRRTAYGALIALLAYQLVWFPSIVRDGLLMFD